MPSPISSERSEEANRKIKENIESVDDVIVIFGVMFSCATLLEWLRYTYCSFNIPRIQKARTLPISGGGGLQSLLDGDRDEASSSENLFIFRGIVSLPPAPWWSKILDHSRSLHSNSPGRKLDCVAFKTTSRLCQHHWFLGEIQWIDKFAKYIPFALVGENNNTLLVNNYHDNEIHPLPFTTIFVNKYHDGTLHYPGFKPCGLLEEKILPLGKEITAIGTISRHGNFLQINACQNLPFFLSDKTKDEMLQDLADEKKSSLVHGIIFGSLSVAFLGCALYRYWKSYRKSLCQLDFSVENSSISSNSSNGKVYSRSTSISHPNAGIPAIIGSDSTGPSFYYSILRRSRAAEIQSWMFHNLVGSKSTVTDSGGSTSSDSCGSSSSTPERSLCWECIPDPREIDVSPT